MEGVVVFKVFFEMSRGILGFIGLEVLVELKESGCWVWIKWDYKILVSWVVF